MKRREGELNRQRKRVLEWLLVRLPHQGLRPPKGVQAELVAAGSGTQA